MSIYSHTSNLIQKSVYISMFAILYCDRGELSEYVVLVIIAHFYSGKYIFSYDSNLREASMK